MSCLFHSKFRFLSDCITFDLAFGMTEARSDFPFLISFHNWNFLLPPRPVLISSFSLYHPSPEALVPHKSRPNAIKVLRARRHSRCNDPPALPKALNHSVDQSLILRTLSNPPALSPQGPSQFASLLLCFSQLSSVSRYIWPSGVSHWEDVICSAVPIGNIRD